LHQKRIEGHGLGLSIVKQIVEKLDGQAGVESQQGEGSLFYFVLKKGDGKNTVTTCHVESIHDAAHRKKLIKPKPQFLSILSLEDVI